MTADDGVTEQPGGQLLALYDEFVERGLYGVPPPPREVLVSDLASEEGELALDEVLAGVVRPELVTDGERRLLAAMAALEGWPEGAKLTPLEFVHAALAYKPFSEEQFPQP